MKIKYYLAILVLLFISCTPVFAYSEVDLNKKGTVNIELTESTTNTKVEGIELTLYKVADARIDETGNLAFTYVDSISCDVDLSYLEDGSISDKIDSCLGDGASSTITNTSNSLGLVTFTNLDLGLYIVRQTNDLKGYSKVKPYLLMLPQVIDEDWTYEIDASPKVNLIKLIDITVIKEWKITNNKMPNSITVQLFKSDELIDEITLTKTDKWTYTWYDLEESDDYSVKEINVPKGYKVTYKKDNTTFTITNIDILPQTGFEFWKLEAITYLGIVLIVIGLGIRKYSNEKTE